MAGKACNRVVLVKGDDWEGLYVNEKLLTEEHKIRLEDGFNLLISHGILVGGISFDSKECDLKWIEEVGNFPPDLKDVKFPSKN